MALSVEFTDCLVALSKGSTYRFVVLSEEYTKCSRVWQSAEAGMGPGSRSRRFSNLTQHSMNSLT